MHCCLIGYTVFCISNDALLLHWRCSAHLLPTMHHCFIKPAPLLPTMTITLDTKLSLFYHYPQCTVTTLPTMHCCRWRRTAAIDSTTSPRWPSRRCSATVAASFSDTASARDATVSCRQHLSRNWLDLSCYGSTQAPHPVPCESHDYVLFYFKC